MSATIKYKGNTIATITTDSTKTLKTSGKYCEGDIVVENVQDGGGGGKATIETFCTDNIQNQFLSDTWSPSCIVEDTTPPPAPKYSYNGVVLPKIPADVLAEFPYAWIRNNDRTGYYDLCLSSSLWYASDAVTISTDSYNTTGIQWYRITKNTPEEAWVFNQAWTSSGGFGNESDRHIMWSNHDIPNGSATATEIYFEGSEPVLVEASEN